MAKGKKKFVADGQLNLFSQDLKIDKLERMKEGEKSSYLGQEISSSALFSDNFDNQVIGKTEEEIKVDGVNGLNYVRNFVTKAEHDFILEKINDEVWLDELKRRVQHYGYKYDYQKHEINKSMYIAPLPNWALEIAQRLHEHYSPTLPDQVIVNEYEPGQGIANHIDCKTCFGDTIISLSLGSPCIMDFINPKQGLKNSLLLEPRSLIVMKGEARYQWAHGIAKRKSDNFEGQVFKRTRRVSLTFRTVILPD